MKAALLQTCVDRDVVQCGVCPQACIIKNNQRGKCGVRENRDGLLIALNDGFAVSKAIDPIEKKPLKRFMPNTMVYSTAAAGCNLACPWCQNHTIANVPLSTTYFGHPMSATAHISHAKKAGATSVAMTYSEPTVALEYTLDIFKAAKQAGLCTIFVSNGYISEAALMMLIPYLDAANIDFKTDNNRVMRSLGGEGSDVVLNTMRTLKNAGVHLEVTSLIVPGVNSSDGALQSMAETLVKTVGVDITWHISRFFPAYRMQHVSPTPIAQLTKAKAIATACGVRDVVLGNV